MAFPEWMTYDGPPTWLALVVALVSVPLALGAYTREHRRDKREQASKVAVWPNKANRDKVTFGLINSSPTPIWGVMVYAYRWGDGGDGKAKPTGFKFDVGVTPPFGEPRYFSTSDLELVDYTTSGYVYAIEFRDSVNRHWYRTRHGFLRSGRYPAEFNFRNKGSLLNSAGHGDRSEVSNS